MKGDWSGSPVPSRCEASVTVSTPPVGSEQGLRDRPSVRRLGGGYGGQDVDVGGARLIVVMGVSGAGKSTLGKVLAERLGLQFIDGDDLQPAANVAKMSRGEPLDDDDRWPWLERIRERAVECVSERTLEGERAPSRPRRVGLVVACSALKKDYRAFLRAPYLASSVLETRFVYLKGERGALMARMQSRVGHYMKAGMLDSQLATLESPEGEPGVVTVSAEMSTEEQVVEALRVYD